MRLESPAFQDGGMIPDEYTCEGRDVSPPLSWDEVPAGAEALALIADDPDAPGRVWVHWVLYDMPPAMGGLTESVPDDPELPSGTRQGGNDFGRVGYGGPCPPSGTHRYVFTLYALSEALGLAPGATKDEVLAAMKGRVMAEARLMGRYRRG